MRQRKLTKEAREKITQIMRNRGEMTTEEAIDLITPHYIFEPQSAKESEVRRCVHQIMRGIKNERGQRACFNLKADGESKYVNIETTVSVDSLDKVEAQLDQQYYGLNESKKRVSRRRDVIIGQSFRRYGQGRHVFDLS